MKITAITENVAIVRGHFQTNIDNMANMPNRIQVRIAFLKNNAITRRFNIAKSKFKIMLLVSFFKFLNKCILKRILASIKTYLEVFRLYNPDACPHFFVKSGRRELNPRLKSHSLAFYR